MSLATTSSWRQSLVLALTGLAFLSLLDWPLQASRSGGVEAWLLLGGLLLLVGTPTLLLVAMLARRAGDGALPEAMAPLTREADAATFWRLGAVGLLLSALLSMVLLAIIAGGHANQVFPPSSGWVLPVATALVMAIAGGGLLLPALWAEWVYGGLSLLVVLLLALAGFAGYGLAGAVYGEAAQQGAFGRLLVMGVSVLLPMAAPMWFAASRLPANASLSVLTLGSLLGLWLLAGLLLLAMTPFVAVSMLNAGADSLLLMPEGLGVVALQMALWVLAVLVLWPLLGLWRSTVQRWGSAVGLPARAASVLTLAVLIALVEFMWWLWQGAVVQQGLSLLLLVALMTVLMLSLFAGWAMKVSHARKSLNLPNEMLYNLWRIGVRWALPLLLLWTLWRLVRMWLA